MKRLLKYLLIFAFIIPLGATTVYAQKSKKTKTHKVRSSKNSDNGDYYNGHKIYTGPRGGRYYINKNGNKTYI